MIKNREFKVLFFKNKQLIFLLSLLLILIGGVCFPSSYQSLATALFVIINMMLGLILLQRRNKFVKGIQVGFIGISLIHLSTHLVTNSTASESTGLFLYGFYYVIFTILFLQDLYREKNLSLSSIYAVFSGFILLAFAFGFALKFGQTVNPSSLNGIQNTDSPADFLYFSFITLLTIGYGDITPNSDAAKRIVVFASLIGHFYTVFITAFILGKLINKQHETSA